MLGLPEGTKIMTVDANSTPMLKKRCVDVYADHPQLPQYAEFCELPRITVGDILSQIGDQEEDASDRKLA
jgi:hypothetical protein